MKRAFFFVLLFLPIVAAAQTSDDMSSPQSFLLRNASGTAANPGPVPNHLRLWRGDTWSAFAGGAVFVTQVTDTREHAGNDSQFFSTNWVTAGVQREFGSRGLLLLRGRMSFEPQTVPEEGSTQLFQNITPDAGGPLVDRMRAHNLIGEAAVHLAYRVGAASYVHLYAAPVGDPALGTVPYAQRLSSEEFAEAPFAYSIQESFHEATRVVTAGVGGTAFSLEGSVFHHSVTTGRHTGIGDGSMDSWSARATLNPTRNVSLQFSRGSLGDLDMPVTSASATYATSVFATSAIWTHRDTSEFGGPQALNAASRDSLTWEAMARGRRLTGMVRAELIDPPFAGIDLRDATTRRAHFTIGAIFDFLSSSATRGGVGVNIDYRTQTKRFEPIYGHKPQSIYLFARLRTNR